MGALASGTDDDPMLASLLTLAVATSPLTTASYQLSVDSTGYRFHWYFQASNTSPTDREWTLTLAPDTSVVSVRGGRLIDANHVVFELVPGENELELKGYATARSFEAPVRAAHHFVAVDTADSSPVQVETTAQRIDIGATNIATRSPTAQGFSLEQGEVLTFKALDAPSPTAFTVDAADTRAFVSADGTVYAESLFVLANTGTSTVPLHVHAHSTTRGVWVEQAPVPFTQAADTLSVRLAANQRTLAIRHEQPLRSNGVFAWGSVMLPSVAGVATEASVDLGVSDAWVIAYQSFASRHFLPLPSTAGLATFALLALWVRRTLRELVTPRTRDVLTAGVTLAAVISTGAFWATLYACAALTLILAVPWLRRRESLAINLSVLSHAAAVVVTLCMVSVVALTTVFGDNFRSLFAVTPDVLSGSTDWGTHLPVSQHQTLSQLMVTPSNAERCFVLLLDASVLRGLELLTWAMLLAVAYGARQTWWQRLRNHLAALVEPRGLHGQIARKY